MTTDQSITLEAAIQRLATHLASMGHHALEASKALRAAQRQLKRQRGQAEATKATTQPSAWEFEQTDPNNNSH